MKRILSLLLIPVMLLLPSACSGGSAATGTNDSAEESAAVSASAQDTEDTEETEKTETIEKTASQSGFADTDFSGVIYMTKDGKTVYASASGVADSETEEPIELDTKFCIGSVSKQFTAAAVLMLQQDGKLDVNDKLSRYFPSYKYGDRLTLKDLLIMRSGIAEFYDVEYIDGAFTELPTGDLRGQITNENTVAENQKLLEEWLLEQPLVFEPDSAYEYSNSNYFLLARVVEKVSGENYRDFIRKRIFQPLGMNSSCFIDDNGLDVPGLAQPTVDPQTVYVGITMGLGDIISNARDIDLWLTSLRTNKLLSEQSVKLMTDDYSPEEEDAYGFGLVPFKRGAYHYGSFSTYQTMVYTSPQEGINLFAVTNDDPNPAYVLGEIGWSLLEREDAV